MHAHSCKSTIVATCHCMINLSCHKQLRPRAPENQYISNIDTTMATTTSVPVSLSQFTNNSTSSTSSNNFTDYGLPFIFGVISFLGIFGNGLVCFVFWMEKSVFGSVTSTLILSQSLIDLITSVIFAILKFAPGVAAKSSSLFTFICYIWISEFPFWSLSYASTFNLMLLSVERYVAICRPIKHRSIFTQKRTKVYCLLVWLSGFLLQLYLPLVHHISPEMVCYFAWPNIAAVQKFVGFYVFFLEFLIPLVIIIAAYTNIWNSLRKRVNSDQVAVASFSQAKKNVTVTLFLVGICFVVCWTPDAVVYFYFNMGGYYNFQSTFHHIVMILVLGNMCVNPVVYCLKYDKFRRTLKKLFCKGSGVIEVENSGNSQVTNVQHLRDE